jgi:hypothetical protein
MTHFAVGVLVCLFVCLFVYLFICLFVCLFVGLWLMPLDHAWWTIICHMACQFPHI